LHIIDNSLNKRELFTSASPSSSSLFWFSHKINRYKKKFLKSSVKRTKEIIILDWDNCTINIVSKLTNGKTRLVIRTNTNRNSHYMGNKPISLRYMLDIDVQQISDLHSEYYKVNMAAKDPHKIVSNSITKKQYKRCVFKLYGNSPEYDKLNDKDYDTYWIWEWAKKDVDTKLQNIYKLYHQLYSFIREEKEKNISNDQSPLLKDGIFNVQLTEKEIDNNIKNTIVPIVYQPAFDSLQNFVREIHYFIIEKDIVEVSIIFENEQLRRFKYLNKIYEKYRHIVFGRVKDIETFRIHIDSITEKDNSGNNKYCTFKKIYSYKYDITYDTIHGDRLPVKRKIYYYFVDYCHPVVFINTSNHAMAQYDNNRDLWKWEYIPFITSKKRPIKVDNKSRKEIDKEFPSALYSLRNYIRSIIRQ
jgi:hypothetical protein